MTTFKLTAAAIVAFAAMAVSPAQAQVQGCKPGDIFRGVDASGQVVCMPAPRDPNAIRPLPEWVMVYPNAVRLQESTLRDLDRRGVRPVSVGLACTPF